MNRTSTLGAASWILSAIGALNWGSVGLTGVNLVESLFGRDTFMSRLIYALVGLAGGWSAYRFVSAMTRPRFRREIASRFSEAA